VTAKLSLRDIAVRRAEIEILRVPSLDLVDGEVLAVLGPNGAGKSTLMGVLGLLERPSEGTVQFEGQPAIDRELPLRRRMAAVFQESLLLNRSVEANVALGLAMRGVPRTERLERVARWLARFGVASLAKRSARSLSGGEAQRVSLARAFALEPEVLLLDEPFSALDQPTREALVEELASVLQETSLTTVFVTHDRDEAARLADRVAVLARGCLLQVGPMAEVFSMPADETVAAYVGVENVVPGDVIDVADGLVLLEAGRAQIEVAAQHFDAPAALICLRPEDITLSASGRDAPTSARNHLLGNVERIVAAGGEVRVELDCGFHLVASITRRSLEELGLALGSPVVASFKATAVHLIPRGRERPAARVA
jgi:tungstate transport system ATP-binding protein